MDKEKIISFFNALAASWDQDSVYNKEIINEILDNADISEGKKVLDIACGTGFLFNDYYKRNVMSVTGIDISEKMLDVCSLKFPKANLICGDAECYRFSEKYDSIVIHNAFPHFCEPLKLFENLSIYLNDGGRLTVSHDMSRDELNSFHGKRAADVSALLPKADAVADIMSSFLSVDRIINNDRMYLVSGIKE